MVSNTFTITMAVFDVGQYVVNAAGGVISSDTAINVDSMLEAMNTAMESMNIGELVVLALESMLVSLCMKILSVLITVILYGRMIEIYLTPRLRQSHLQHSLTGNGGRWEITISVDF